MRALENGNYDELVDPYLERNYPVHKMARMAACAACAACAAASIRHSACRRPKMSQVTYITPNILSVQHKVRIKNTFRADKHV